MKKLIFKTFLVGVLSISLMLLNFNLKEFYFFSNKVFAEEVKQESVGDTLGAANLLTTLTVSAVSMLAMKLYNYKMTTDILLAAAGGAAFMGGDVAAFFQDKAEVQELTTQITRDKNGNLDAKQIESLEILKKSNESARDTADTKKTLQMAGAVAFTAAAGTALVFGLMEESAEKICISGLLTATTTAYTTSKLKCASLHTSYSTCAASCVATGVGVAACQAGCYASLEVPALACDVETTACKAKIEADAIGIQKFIALRVPPGPSAIALQSTTALATTLSTTIPQSAAACAIYSTEMFAAEQAGMCIPFLQSAILHESGAPPIKAVEVIKPEPAPTAEAAPAPAQAAAPEVAPAPAPAAAPEVAPAPAPASAPEVAPPPAAAPAPAPAAAPEPTYRFADPANAGSYDPGVYDRAAQFLKNQGLPSNNLPTSVPKVKRSNLKDDRLQILYDHSQANNDDSYLKKYLVKTLQIVFPSAHAQGIVGIASKAAIAYLLSTMTSLSVLIDNQMLTPLRRAVIWGVLAGLATAAVMATSSEAETIQKNIDAIDKVLGEMRNLNGGVAMNGNGKVNSNNSNANGINRANIASGNNKDINLAESGKKLPCFTGSSSSNCPSPSSLIDSMPLEGMPEGLGLTIRNVAKVADGLNNTSTISGSTLSGARGLGAQMNAVSGDLSKLRKKMQNVLIAPNDKLDLNKAHSQHLEELNSAIKSNLSNYKMTTKNALASIGPGGFGSSGFSSSFNSSISSSDKKNELKESMKGIGVKGAPLAPVVAPDLNVKLDEFNLNGDDPNLKLENATPSGAQAPTSMDQYEVGSDIIKDKDLSLFDIISNRYQKSYHRLFDKILKE